MQTTNTLVEVPGYFWLALREYGVSEYPGTEENPRILEYHSKTGLSAIRDEIAWCASFVNWCLSEAGLKGTYAANARSFLSWGVKTTAPVMGDICVFWRDHIDSYMGHVGFYVSENEESIFVLGGNQGNRVSIKPYSKSQLLEFRHAA